MKTEREFIIDILKQLGELDYIEPESIPNIDLYMDQVTTFMDSHLAHSKRYEDDKILTKTMINNYTKNDLLPPPEKKKYTRDHILMLTLIYYYKNLLSISDIQTLLEPLKEYYFEKGGDHDLADVYERIFGMCMSERNSYVREILKKYDVACEAFPDEADGDAEEQDYMRKFSFVSLLGFDIYLKKVVMESIVDEMREKQEKKKEAEKKDSKEKKDK